VPADLNYQGVAAFEAPVVSALLRQQLEDFEVEEQLGFVPEGAGEHAFLFIEKRGLNSQDVVAQLSRVAGVHQREIGLSGMKDKHAVTRQWFSVGLAGRDCVDWTQLQSEQLSVLQQTWHRRKLRRGVHESNRFRITLRQLRGDRQALLARLEAVKVAGVPNYYGEQRFGIQGRNLELVRRWAAGQMRAPRRNQRGLYLSAARSYLFNRLLSARVQDHSWDKPLAGDVCILRGGNSLFCCEQPDADIGLRAGSGDLSPGLPLWGRGTAIASAARWQAYEEVLLEETLLREFLLDQGLDLAWRTARLLPDDFCWEFCDDDALVLEFRLQPGGFATAVLRELVDYTDQTRG
jgi:tRNA pseudouridine13 synthase